MFNNYYQQNGNNWGQKKQSPPIKEKFKVITTRKDGSRHFYVIEYNGSDHYVKMFDSQITQPVPAEIDCVIKKFDDGTYRISQDFAPIIAKLYHVGETYTFSICRDKFQTNRFDVKTDEGFCFFIEESEITNIREHQTVRGKILSMDGIKVGVKVLRNDSSKEAVSTLITPLTLKKLADDDQISGSLARLAERIFKVDKSFEEARQKLQDGDAEWLGETLSVISDNMGYWLKGLNDGNQRKILNSIRRVCINLVERSGMTTGDGNAQIRNRLQIANAIRQADTYLLALQKTDDDSVNDFAQDIITSLRSTGYIYEPAQRLHTLLGILTLRKDRMQEVIPNIMSVLSAGKYSDWQQDPLRSALVDLLVGYVEMLGPDADAVFDINFGSNKRIINNMVKALAIILMLSKEDDDINRHVYMSKICRYSSLFNPQIGQTLNDKAFIFLFKSSSNRERLPFSWSDVEPTSMNIISVKLNTFAAGPVNYESQYHEGRKASVMVAGNSITIFPSAVGSRNSRNALPKELLQWKKFKILVRSQNIIKPNANTIDTYQYYRMWQSINDALLNSAGDKSVNSVAKQASLKMQVDVGDEVDIAIVSRLQGVYDDDDNPLFRCVVVDDKYDGEGVVSPRNFIRYNVLDADVDDFRDDYGRAYLLRARVTDVNENGKATFSAVEDIARFVGENLEEDLELVCKMTIMGRDGSSLLISERGFSLKISADDGMPRHRNGECVRAIVTNVYPNGNVDATYLGECEEDEYIYDKDCLHNILHWYAEGRTIDKLEDDEEDEFDDEMPDQDDTLDREEMQEFIRIIDRQSTLSEDRVLAYNYLALAKLLSDVIGEETLSEQFEERMYLINTTQQFALNGEPQEGYEQHFIRSEKILSGNPDLKDKASRLFCISRLRKDGEEERLLQIAKENRGQLTGEIAELVLAHNISRRLNITKAADSLLDEIREKMKIDRQESTLEYMGEESQTLEFKSSLVYPSENQMRRNMEQQTLHIMERTVGMLNTEYGGKIIVGVNNSGLAVGLDADFRAISKSNSYDVEDCKDKMKSSWDGNVANHIQPKSARDRIKRNFVTKGDRLIFVIDIAPMTKDDEWATVNNQMWIRYGTSTQLVSNKEKANLTKKNKNI